jgi:hypothetical protein
VATTLQTVLGWVDDDLFPKPQRKDGKLIWPTSIIEGWITERPVLIKNHISRPDSEAKAMVRMQRIRGEVYIIKDYRREVHQRHVAEA